MLSFSCIQVSLIFIYADQKVTRNAAMLLFQNFLFSLFFGIPTPISNINNILEFHRHQQNFVKSLQKYG